jgi:hypothetical protein
MLRPHEAMLLQHPTNGFAHDETRLPINCWRFSTASTNFPNDSSGHDGSFTEAAGVKSVPVLVIGEAAYHINFCAGLIVLKKTPPTIMPAAPNNHEAHGCAERVRGCLRGGEHAEALQLLPAVPCSAMLSNLAALIPQNWPKQDINTAWNAVSHSPLNAAEKQIMFNELWG